MAKYKFPSFTRDIVAFLISVDEGTPRRLATATQPQFPRKIADFKQETGFQISRHILRNLTFD
jgi:hypothetical protein